MMIPNATVIAPWCLACQHREQDLSPMSQREKTPKLECQRDNPHVAADGSSWPLTSKYKVEWIFYKQLTLTMLALNEKWNLLTCFRRRINTKEAVAGGVWLVWRWPQMSLACHPTEKCGLCYRAARSMWRTLEYIYLSISSQNSVGRGSFNGLNSFFMCEKSALRNLQFKTHNCNQCLWISWL